MENTNDLQLVRSVVSKLRACGHFLYHRTGGRPGRRRILRAISQTPGILQRELQDRLNIQSGSLSEMVIKLEAEGLIEKTRSQTDGRQWALRLTPQGLEETARLNTQHDAHICKMMSCFTDQELKALYTQLDAMLAHWNEVELYPENTPKSENGQ